MPESSRVTVTVSFTIDPERYSNVWRWLRGLPRGKKSQSICEALDSGLSHGGVTIGDVYEAVKELERRLQAGAGLQLTELDDGPQWNGPTEHKDALDDIGEF